jgi:hypothetical protein
MYDMLAKDSKGDHGQGGTKQDDFLILGRRFFVGFCRRRLELLLSGFESPTGI